MNEFLAKIPLAPECTPNEMQFAGANNLPMLRHAIIHNIALHREHCARIVEEAARENGVVDLRLLGIAKRIREEN